MREDIGRGVRRDGDGWWRGDRVVCVCARVGRKNGGVGGGIFNRVEGGRNVVSQLNRQRGCMYVRACVQYNKMAFSIERQRAQRKDGRRLLWP